MNIIKKIASVLLAVILCSALFAVTMAAEEKEKLYIYNWGQYIGDGSEDTIDVIAAFEAKYPGIDVIYTTYDSNETLYTKLKSGGSNYDIIIPSDYMIEKLIEENMLQKINLDNIPNYANVNSTFINNNYYDSANEYSVPYTYGTVGIIYNTEHVTGEITSWSALWDENYKGKILMFDNPRDSFAIAEFRLGIDVNTTKTSDYDKCAELLGSQTGVLKGYVMDQIFDQMINGDAWIAPYYAGDFLTMYSENESLAFAYPEEGYNYFVDAICIPKDAQNVSAAEKFIDFLCDPEVAGENSEAIGYATPIDGADQYMSAEYAEQLATYLSPEIIANGTAFNGLDNDTVNYMNELWSGVKAGSFNVWLIVAIVAGAVIVVAALIVIISIKKKKKKALYEQA